MLERLTMGFLCAASAAAALILISVIIAAIAGETPDSFALPKSIWECSDTVAQTLLLPVGKVLVPTTFTECVEYRRVENSKP
ncbi:hypothetical protein [Paracoccus sp. (in: a-proteobacteria)]|uniref:hypothetical protein n=1 Tax=Paracoccus sp. TaxID=267 RepID=UPI002899CF50|nr:hypothetical protein [Paracoccus sp. (in: a-proteobacteria)]